MGSVTKRFKKQILRNGRGTKPRRERGPRGEVGSRLDPITREFWMRAYYRQTRLAQLYEDRSKDIGEYLRRGYLDG